jgi:ubiquinone/menaquinone biosynthesis C-methylase UbiE
MSTQQKEGFLDGEGDRWFDRNRGLLEGPSALRDQVVGRLHRALTANGGRRVLEVGCGQAVNLAALDALEPIEAHGIDPSGEAIAAARARYPSLALQRGTADQLPFADASFDLVWFGFCLYLVDRPLLHRAVAEADRVLRDGGLLAILDFDPDAPCVRPYHHLPPLQSYKMDYARLFLANPAYTLVDKLPMAHDGGPAGDPQDRVALTLCRKNLARAYHPLSPP